MRASNDEIYRISIDNIKYDNESLEIDSINTELESTNQQDNIEIPALYIMEGLSIALALDQTNKEDSIIHITKNRYQRNRI